MTLQKGSEVLLKVGDGGDPESFVTVGGLQNTSIFFSSRAVTFVNNQSNLWQEVLYGGGVRSVNITGDGLFTDSASETLIRQLAFNNEVRNYEIGFGNGDSLRGAFKITTYNRTAQETGEEEFSISLTSSGEIMYTDVG